MTRFLIASPFVSRSNFWATRMGRFSNSIGRSLPLLVGGSVLTATLFLWQALVAQERAYIEQETRLEAVSVKNELTALMESRIQALVRMSERWERRGKTPKEDWEFEAGLNVRDFKGFQAIRWVDSSSRVRWVVPLAGNEASQNLNMDFEQRRRTAMDAARKRRNITITRSIDLVQGGKGFQVYVPIFQGETFNGFINGVFHTHTVLDTILAGEKIVAPGYAIALFDGEEEIYRRDNTTTQHSQEWSQETNIDLHGTTWRLQILPQPALVNQLQSPLPSVALVGGLLMASLLALAVHLAQRARLRAGQAEAANFELETEIADRQRTEQLLGMQHTTTRVLAETVTLDEATPKILQVICESLGWQLGELWIVERKANVLRCVETWHLPSLHVPEFEMTQQDTIAPGVCLSGRIWASGEPTWIADVVQDTKFIRVASAAKEGLHGAFGFPIFSGSEILGVIVFFSHQIQQPEEDLRQMMTDIGSQVGQFIERKWAEEGLRKAHDELERRVEARTIELSKSNQRLLQQIKERKRAEQQIKASLKEKEVLLKEIHHRVKNNLQVISSLLNLQRGSIKDPQTLEIFQESQNRVESMALIHEQLYRSKDLSQIDFADYIRNLVANLFCSYEVRANAITLKINVDNVLLDINAAIPCGLIINELIANSLKYAFPVGKDGELWIQFSSKDDKFTLIVADNGVGIPKDLDFQNTNSLGLQLVNALTEQLEGNIKLDNSVGTKFIITFTKKSRE